jgi:hypothetical protein
VTDTIRLFQDVATEAYFAIAVGLAFAVGGRKVLHQSKRDSEARRSKPWEEYRNLLLTRYFPWRL